MDAQFWLIQHVKPTVLMVWGQLCFIVAVIVKRVYQAPNQGWSDVYITQLVKP